MTPLSKFTPSEGKAYLKQFDTRGLLGLATTNNTIPYHARAKLMTMFQNALADIGLPPGFYDILKNHGGIVSGSFVAQFLNPRGMQGWLEQGGDPAQDVDVYVGKGRIPGFLNALDSLPDSNIVHVLRVRPATAAGDAGAVAPDGTVVTHLQEGPFYNNPAIECVVRLTLMSPSHGRCQIDLVESKSESPFMPILLFDLSHLRVGLGADGLFEFHPTWNDVDPNLTFVSLRVYEMANDEGRLPRNSRDFFEKYKKRGYNIIDQRESGVTPGERGHLCRVSFDCPLSLRNTIDAGVRFTPFTEDAAWTSLTEHHFLLSNPVTEWCFGGKCSQSPLALEIPMARPLAETPVQADFGDSEGEISDGDQDPPRHRDDEDRTFEEVDAAPNNKEGDVELGRFKKDGAQRDEASSNEDGEARVLGEDFTGDEAQETTMGKKRARSFSDDEEDPFENLHKKARAGDEEDV